MNQHDINMLDAQMQLGAKKTGGCMNTKLIDVKTLVQGTDISVAGKEDLVRILKNLEREETDVAAVRTPSATLEARQREIQATLKVVAAELDKRFGPAQGPAADAV